MTIDMNPTTSDVVTPVDRVRQNTSAALNQGIDHDTAQRVKDYGTQSDVAIAQRILALEREWDTERVLEANASVLAFTGLLLGVFVHPNGLWLTGIVLPFLFQHAVQGWCPPLPILRRLGVRTRQEIDREVFALKALRGDFAAIPTDADGERRAQAALEAVGIQVL